MSKSIKEIIKYTWVGLMTITVIGLVIVLKCAHSNAFIFPTDKLIDIAGILATATGLFLTGLFAVLAINAYSHIKEILSIRDDILYSKKETDDLKKANTQLLLDGTNMQLGYAVKMIKMGIERKFFEEWYNYFQLQRARFSFHPTLDMQTRGNLLRELLTNGGYQEIFELEKIIQNKKEPEMLKETAKYVRYELKKKLGLT